MRRTVWPHSKAHRRKSHRRRKGRQRSLLHLLRLRISHASNNPKITMRTLKNLFLDELADRLDSEMRLVNAMPKMIKTATCANLKKVIETHLMQTKQHVTKVEKVFKLFGEKPSVNRCEATLGLLTEGTEVSTENKGSSVINAALVLVAQKVEHYEIASYG